MPVHDQGASGWPLLPCDSSYRAAPELGQLDAPADPDTAATGERRRPPPAQWRVLASIAVGGVLGAQARYGLGVAFPHHAGQWPVATLVINASGCLLIGVLMVVITQLTRPHPLIRPLLGVGVLGGYTTFSTYSTDLVLLWQAGRAGAALAYLVATPTAAFAAVWAGTALTRMVAGALTNGEGATR